MVQGEAGTISIPVASEAGSSVSKRKPAHIPALDGLRGLAILMVVFSHCTVLVPANAVDRAYFALVNWGWMGVDLFFVLSGFLITGILCDAKNAPHYFRNFYMRRMLRIFPLYYLFLALMFGVVPHLHNALLAEQSHVGGSQLWYWFYASNVSYLLHGFDSQVLSVTWSLAVEEHFYLVWPLVVLLLGRRTLLKVCGGIIATALVLRVCFVLCGGVMGAAAVPYTFTFCRMDSLAMGAAIALTARGTGGLDRLARPARWCAPFAAGVVVGLCVLGQSAYWVNKWLQTLGFTFISGFFAMMLVIVLTSPPGAAIPRFFSSAALRIFGKYSYCIYLVHAFVRSGMRNLVYKPQNFLTIHSSQIPGQFIFYGLAITASLITAMVSWQLIEKPFLKLKRFFPAH